jgi:3-oxoadipate enol-lactonase
MTFFQHKSSVLHYRWIDNQHPSTFVFINSLGTDFRIWDGVIENLRKHGNILLHDKRGHGLSDVVADTNGLASFTDDVQALLNHLKINTFVPVGLSVGGMIAQVLASRIPQRIEKLILCDTRHKIASTQFWNERIALVREKGLPAVSEAVMQRWFSEKFRIENATVVSGYRNMLERCPVAGYIKTCEAIRDADLTSTANTIKIPTLCIVGSEDKSTPPEEVKDLANLIVGSRYEVMKGSGHIPCVDNPAALSKLIIDFMA